jgi:alpha-beta hydrolase superfamily lysophospholipase
MRPAPISSSNVPDATLRGWVVNRDQPDPILYFGGNAERIEANREDFARMFPGRSVYLVAYRGYGASTGEPGEAALVPDALAVFDEVQRRHPGQRIAVIGRSLGSGIASQVAGQRPVARLALITPFDSMIGAAKTHYPIFPVDWLLDERYESAKALRGFANRS